MLMSIKIKEVSVFPVLEIIMGAEDEVLMKNPDHYYYRLHMMLERRIGRNILQEFLDTEFTHEGIDWIVHLLLLEDKRLLRKMAAIKLKAAEQAPESRRI